jgi:hypothetical protein
MLADVTELAQQLGQLTTVRRHRFLRIRHFLVPTVAPHPTVDERLEQGGG